jgi:hypothetical protein
LNYFFPTEIIAPHYATPLPFREGAWGLGPDGAFVPDSFRSRIAVKPRYPQAIHSPKLPPTNPATSIKIDHRKIHTGFGGSRSTRRAVGAVGVELESNCSRTTVNKAKIRPPKTLCTFKAEGAERSLRSINQHFLPPIHRFSNIELSNIQSRFPL